MSGHASPSKSAQTNPSATPGARNRPLADSCDAGTGTRPISPGQSKTLRIGILLKGTYEYLCTVPGHAAAGMKGILTVT